MLQIPCKSLATKAVAFSRVGPAYYLRGQKVSQTLWVILLCGNV